MSDADNWNPTDEMFISAVGRGHNSMCATDVSDVCVSELHDVCLHEFDMLQGSPTHIISQIQTSQRHHGVLTFNKVGDRPRKSKDHYKEHHTIQRSFRTIASHTKISNGPTFTETQSS